jgi:hypothetical protein
MSEPVVFPDINPVLLMRVHPEAESMDDAEAAAVLQGEETAAAGADTEASQQEPGKPPEQVIPEPPATAPPVNVDVPYVSQTGPTLSCTMGNWENVPTSYSYRWQIDGTNVGADSALYTVTAGDVGGMATCTVTATNARGSTTAPASNPVQIA